MTSGEGFLQSHECALADPGCRFFPAGVPHSIQANDDGVEFLLVFNQGDFSEDDTNLVTEMFLRNPLQVGKLRTAVTGARSNYSLTVP